MADQPEDQAPLPEDEGFREFQDTLRRLLNTPHQPHAPLKPKPDKER
jgi:hypothetical protein